ncbi:MAG: neocarzinostatin apoprotein domain-containing protein, partial [Acidimicrobiales bacterium]
MQQECMFGHRVDAGGCDAINADLVWIRIPVSFAATTPSPNAPAVLVASPSIGLDNGQSVDVQATGFTPGSELTVTLCPSDPLTAYGDAYDPARFTGGCPFVMA